MFDQICLGIIFDTLLLFVGGGAAAAVVVFVDDDAVCNVRTVLHFFP